MSRSCGPCWTENRPPHRALQPGGRVPERSAPGTGRHIVMRGGRSTWRWTLTNRTEVSCRAGAGRGSRGAVVAAFVLISEHLSQDKCSSFSQALGSPFPLLWPHLWPSLAAEPQPALGARGFGAGAGGGRSSPLTGSRAANQTECPNCQRAGRRYHSEYRIAFFFILNKYL